MIIASRKITEKKVTIKKTVKELKFRLGDNTKRIKLSHVLKETK